MSTNSNLTWQWLLVCFYSLNLWCFWVSYPMIPGYTLLILMVTCSAMNTHEYHHWQYFYRILRDWECFSLCLTTSVLHQLSFQSGWSVEVLVRQPNFSKEDLLVSIEFFSCGFDIATQFGDSTYLTRRLQFLPSPDSTWLRLGGCKKILVDSRKSRTAQLLGGYLGGDFSQNCPSTA